MLIHVEEGEYNAEEETLRLHSYVEPKAVVILGENRLWLLYRITGPDWTYKVMALPFDLAWLERNDEIVTKHWAWRLCEKFGPVLSCELNRLTLSPGIAHWFVDLRTEINLNRPVENVNALVLEVIDDVEQPEVFGMYGGSSVVNRIGLVPLHLTLDHHHGALHKIHYDRGWMIFNPTAQINISEIVPVHLDLYDDQFSYYPGSIITQPGEMFVAKSGTFEYVGNMHESLTIPLDIKEVEVPEPLQEIHEALLAGEYRWVMEMDTIDDYIEFLLK